MFDKLQFVAAFRIHYFNAQRQTEVCRTEVCRTMRTGQRDQPRRSI